jgi:hypothetical protein
MDKKLLAEMAIAMWAEAEDITSFRSPAKHRPKKIKNRDKVKAARKQRKKS